MDTDKLLSGQILGRNIINNIALISLIEQIYPIEKLSLSNDTSILLSLWHRQKNYKF